jgi:AraC-like DNA-binding protein
MSTILDTQSTNYREIIDFREIGLNYVQILGHYRYNSVQQPLAQHVHSGMMEICFLKKGEQHYEVGGTDWVVKGGEVFVTFPGEEHGSGKAPENKGELYWMIISLEKGNGSFLNLAGKEKEELISSLKGIDNRHFPVSGNLVASLSEIFNVYHKDRSDLKNVTIKNLLLAVLLDLIRASRLPARIKENKKIKEAVFFIGQHLEENINLQEIANHVGLSVSHLKVLFKREVGLPPAGYYLTKKIERSKELLALPGWNTTKVAFELNFSSSQYFSTVFKRLAGKTPMEFVREIRQNAANQHNN